MNVAMVSSNGDEAISSIIREIYQTIGLRGAISIQDGDAISRETRVEYKMGMSFDSGFLSPYFAEDRKLVKYGSETATG